MNCESCGAPLESAKCLYCGRKNAEFLALEKKQIEQSTIEQPQFLGRENANYTTIPNERFAIEKDQEQAIVKFILCLFLGFFGAHYFYEKRIGLGLLFLFTWGFLGLGWFIDCIRLFFNMIRAFVK